MAQLQEPVVTFLDDDSYGYGIGIVFEVLADVVAHLIVGAEPERNEQDQLIQMFASALGEAVADVRAETEWEENNHEHHRP